MRPALRIGLLLAAVVLFIDRITKDWALGFVLEKGAAVEVTPFFNLVAVWNRGVSFGMFQSGDTGRYILITLALAICIGLFVWLWRAEGRLLPAALGLMIGGALGNVFDRMREEKAVFDFLDFHLAGYHWPAFNIADSAIFVGVAMILLESYLAGKDQNQKKETTGDEDAR